MLNTNNRKIQNFKNNKRGLYSLYLLLLMLVFTLPAEFIANDKPLLIKYDNNLYFPIIKIIRKRFLEETLKPQLIIKIDL